MWKEKLKSILKFLLLQGSVVAQMCYRFSLLNKGNFKSIRKWAGNSAAGMDGSDKMVQISSFEQIESLSLGKKPMEAMIWYTFSAGIEKKIQCLLNENRSKLRHASCSAKKCDRLSRLSNKKFSVLLQSPKLMTRTARERAARLWPCQNPVHFAG